MTHPQNPQGCVPARSGLSRARHGLSLGATAGILALAGCDGEEAPIESQRQAVSVQQGMTLQGMTLQGMTLQGMTLQGMTLQGTTLQGTTLQGTTLQGTTLQGTTLQGTTLQGTTLQGTTLQGTTLQGTTLQGTGQGTTSLSSGGSTESKPSSSAATAVALSGGKLLGVHAGDTFVTTGANGAQVRLRVDSMQLDPGNAAGDVMLYSLSLYSEEVRDWQNPCTPDPWGQRYAIAVAGSWDASGAFVDAPGTFSFACTSGVVAKCVRWGYKPWLTVNGKSLRPYHQACTRMARADYCGDGVSHTKNGTTIDVYDDLGIQSSEGGPDFLFEGAWTPDGAFCLSKERWSGLTAPDQKGASRESLSCAAQVERIGQLAQQAPTTIAECTVKLRPDLVGDVLLYNRSRLNVASGAP